MTPGGGRNGRAADRFLPRLVQRPLPVEVAQHLLVAERAARRLAVAQSARDQLAHLGLEAGRHMRVDPGLDAAVEFLARQREADLDGGVAAVVAGEGRAERAAGQLDDLQGAHDPAAVAGQDRGGGGRVERGQPPWSAAPPASRARTPAGP